MPIPALGMWFFVASEAMFFVPLLGSFVVLESAGGQHEIFVQSSKMLNGWIGIGSVVVLLLGSMAIYLRAREVRLIVMTAGIFFLSLQFVQWHLLLPDNGPWRNNFFGIYFLFSSVHGLHVVGGILGLIWSMRKATLPDAMQIYWHFVNAVGVLSLLVLYFV